MNIPKTKASSESIGKYTLHYDQIIGKGATSTVFKGEVTHSKEPVAIKLIDLSQHCDVAQQYLLENQCKALRELDHCHLLKLVEIVERDKRFYIVTKYYDGITLQECLRGPFFSEQQTCHIFSKILEAVSSLIGINILHRDLKPSNIIIDKQFNPVIIDFGFCEIIHATKISRVFNVGSPSYMAPQAYLKTLYSEKSESWSIGMILYEMLHHRTLDQGIPIKDFFEKIRLDSNFVSSQIKRGIAPEFREIIEKSFKYNSMDRISITGMKYLIDVLVLRQKRQASKKGLKIPKPPPMVNFNQAAKQIVKFNHQPLLESNRGFQTISPVKNRDISIKFVHREDHKQTLSNQRPKQRSTDQKFHSQKDKKSISITIPKQPQPTNHTDYFSSKIKKGVFDLKRFSNTQREIYILQGNKDKGHHFSTKRL